MAKAAESVSLQEIIGERDGIAHQIAELWNQWKQAKDSYESLITEVKNYVYATSSRDTTNIQNPFSNTTNIPKITQIYDNLNANYLSALFPHDDWLSFVGNDPESVKKEIRNTIEAYLKTKHRLDKFTDKIAELLDDWIIQGNAFAQTVFVNEFHEDPDTGKRFQSYKGPRVLRIDPDDIAFNIRADSFEDSPKIIRTLKTMGELARDVEENPSIPYSKEVLEKAKNVRTAFKNAMHEEAEEDIQISFDGFGTISDYLNSGYVEILEFYGDIWDETNDEFFKNHVITVVDRSYVIRSEPLNTWTGRPYIYHIGWRKRPDNLWGMGPLENLVGMQYRINLLENGKADAFDQMLDPDRVIKGDVEQEQDGAAITYYVPEDGDVRNLAPDTTMLNADTQVEEMERKMEEFAGAPRQAMGIRTPGEKTAFEVQQLENAASRLFQHKISFFESNFLEKIVNAEIELAKRFLDGSDIIKVTDDESGVEEFITITNEKLRASGQLVPRGARHFARKNQLMQEIANLQQGILQDPEVLQHISSKKLAQTVVEDLLDFQRFDLFKPYVRIEEQSEAQQLIQTAQQQAASAASLETPEAAQNAQQEIGQGQQGSTQNT